MSTKYVPISVRVPGSGGDELSLTPSEARQLKARLEKKLAEFDAIKARFGISAARKANKRPYLKALRAQAAETNGTARGALPFDDEKNG